VHKFMSRLDLEADVDAYLTNAYTLEAGKVFAYTRTDGTMAVSDTGQGTLYYLKAERVDDSTGLDLVQNTGTDITLDLRWMDWVIRYAAMRACMDKGSDEALAKAQVFKQQINTLPSKD
jgi:hypothetical protein